MNFETILFLIVYGIAIYLIRGEVDRLKAEKKQIRSNISNFSQYLSDKKRKIDELP
jgi:hypothetical protein